jgi:hypothetical protein
MKKISQHGNMSVVEKNGQYAVVHKSGRVMSQHSYYHNAFATAETTRGYKTPYGSGVTGAPRR